MPLTITFPDELATTLRTKAEPTLEEVVAKIKATPPNPAMIQYPTESLLEYLLESTPEPDPNFDIEGWDREWAKVEAELEALDPPYDPQYHSRTPAREFAVKIGHALQRDRITHNQFDCALFQSHL